MFYVQARCSLTLGHVAVPAPRDWGSAPRWCPAVELTRGVMPLSLLMGFHWVCHPLYVLKLI